MFNEFFCILLPTASFKSLTRREKRKQRDAKISECTDAFYLDLFPFPVAAKQENTFRNLETRRPR